MRTRQATPCAALTSPSPDGQRCAMEPATRGGRAHGGGTRDRAVVSHPVLRGAVGRCAAPGRRAADRGPEPGGRAARRCQGGLLVGHRGAVGRCHPRRPRRGGGGRPDHPHVPGRHRLRRRAWSSSLREMVETEQPDIIFGDSFGNEEAVRAVAADYPEIPFVFGSGGGPAEPNFSVFDNWIHEPAYLAGMLAGGLTKTNIIGVVAGYPGAGGEPHHERVHRGRPGAEPGGRGQGHASSTAGSTRRPPRRPPLAQIGAGADVLYAERAGVIEAASEQGVLVVGNMATSRRRARERHHQRHLEHDARPSSTSSTRSLGGTYTAQDLKDFSMVAKGGAALAPINAAVTVRSRPGAAPRTRSQRPRRPSIRPALFRVDINESQPAGLVTQRRGRVSMTRQQRPARRPVARPPVGPATAAGDRPRSGCGASPSASGTSSPTIASTSTCERGEVHALLGENGAGKTTLMRILYGLTHADAATIEVDGRPVTIRSPRDAIAAGIGMVTQHFSLVRPMTVAENLALGRVAAACASTSTPARRSVREASARVRHRGRPGRARRATSRSGEQQRVEIVKALARDCRVLILDEPTAVLVPQEVEALFATLRRLVADGLAVVFISHKLGEVRAISRPRQRPARRGRSWARAPGATDERELARMMVGRPTFGVARAEARHARPATASRVLRVEGLSAAGRARPARAARRLPRGRRRRDRRRRRRVGQRPDRAGGGALGHAPPDRRARARRRTSTLTGAGPDGRSWPRASGRIPEDRHASLVLDLSVALNLVLERIDDFRVAARASTSAASRRTPGTSSSGSPSRRDRTTGSGRCPAATSRRCCSRACCRAIHASSSSRSRRAAWTWAPPSTCAASSWRGARRGAAILLVSEDLDELLALSDRLVVLYEGRVVGRMRGRGRGPGAPRAAHGRSGARPRDVRLGAAARRSLRSAVASVLGHRSASRSRRSRSRSLPSPARPILVAGANPIDAYVHFFVTPLTSRVPVPRGAGERDAAPASRASRSPSRSGPATGTSASRASCSWVPSRPRGVGQVVRRLAAAWSPSR